MRTLILLTLTCIGCGLTEPLVIERGPNANTTTPNFVQIERCRKSMHIAEDIEMVPQGLFMSTGMDTNIAFKFIAKANDPKEIFDASFVDSRQFEPVKSYYGFNENHVSAPWWEPSQHKLTGGEFLFPSADVLNVGLKPNDDNTITVYAFWLEF